MALKKLAAVSVSIIVLGSLTACGGSPDDASEKDFCSAMEKLAGAENFKDSQDAADDLADVGTPEDIADDARDGFDLLIDAYGDADDEGDLENEGDNLSKDEKSQAEAFGAYYVKTCGLGDMPSDLPSDMPSDMPSDVIPSEVPSNLPSDIPTTLPSNLPSEFPSELLSELGSDFPSELLSELQSAYPSN